MERHDVRKFRDRHGLTQEQLAGKVGVAEKTVRRWEQGHNNVSPIVHGRLQRVQQEMEQKMAANAPPAPTKPVRRSVSANANASTSTTSNGPQRRVAHLPGDTPGEKRLSPLATVLPSMGRV